MATIKGWTWNPEDHTANSHFPLMVNFVYRCKRKTKPVWHSYCSSVTHKALLWHKCPRCFDPLVHHFYLLGLLGAGFHLLYNFGNKKKAIRIMHRWSAILYPPQRVHNWNPLNKTTEVDVGKLYHKECMRQKLGTKTCNPSFSKTDIFSLSSVMVLKFQWKLGEDAWNEKVESGRRLEWKMSYYYSY